MDDQPAEAPHPSTATSDDPAAPAFRHAPLLQGNAPGHPAAAPERREALPVSDKEPAPDPDAGFRKEFEALASTVLDAAEVASAAASAAGRTATDMAAVTERLQEAERRMKRNGLIALSVFAVLVVSGGALLGTATYVMSKRIQRLDATVLAVGKRSVELNATVKALDVNSEGLKTIAEQMAALSTSLEAVQAAQSRLDAKVDGALKQAESTLLQLPDRTARQVATGSDAVNRQLQALGTRLQAQASAVQGLNKDVKDLSASVAAVEGLRRDLQSVVAAQRTRAVEPPPRPAPPPREPMLQYPRPQPQGKEPVAPPG
jgi:hypothetical protein